FDERRIRKCRLRILVEKLHVGVRRRAVRVEVALLDIFSVVAFAARQAEEPFFEDGIAAVPQRDRETDPLMAIGDPGEAILVPAIGARARVVVREVVPCGAIRAVVLAHAAPGALAEIRAPALPV